MRLGLVGKNLFGIRVVDTNRLSVAEFQFVGLATLLLGGKAC
jgi:hypothetical protein